MELNIPSILILLLKTKGTKFAWGLWGSKGKYRYLEFGLNFIPGRLGFTFSLQLNPEFEHVRCRLCGARA